MKTTEQLAEIVIEATEKMSPEDKANVREAMEVNPTDCVLRKLLELNVPLTQENYLFLAFWNDCKIEDLDAELIAELPDQFAFWPKTEKDIN